MASQFALSPEKKRRIAESKRRSAEADEDYDPKAKEAPKRKVEVKPSGTLSKLDLGGQTIRERVASIPRSIATDLFGVNATRANRFGEDAANLVDFIPGVGDAIGAAETAEAVKARDWKNAAINAAGTAVSVVPVVGDVVGKGIKSLAKKGGKEAVEKTTKAAIKVKPPASQFALKPEKKPKQQAITAVSLRDKPLPEAIEIAKSGQHIIPKTEGGFRGAPYSAKTQADIDLIRKKFDEDVAAGAAGADWYPRAQEWIKTMAGNDPARQSELARNLALFSAQADPKGNLGFSVAARNAAIMDMPLEKVRTGTQARTYNKAFGYRPDFEDAAQEKAFMQGKIKMPYDPEAFTAASDIKLGPKTGIYGGHMDPTKVSPTTGTNDIWHARALGYTTPTGKPWSSALTPQQHSWMDAETVLAVDRANAAGVGGRTDWTPGEIQAAPWVAGKGRGLEKSRGMTAEEGLAEASKTYPDYAPSFTAYGTHEMTPGRQTGHLPGVANADQATRDQFAEGPRNWWQDEQGRDVLYDAQGAYVGPSQSATGVYGDPVQFNPMQAAKPLVGLSGPSGRRVVDEASQQMMTGTEGFRAMMDAQDAGAWSMTIPGQKVGHNNAMDLLLSKPPSREELASIMATGKGQGLGDLVHYGGDKAMLTEFYPGKTGIGAKQAKQMNAELGGAATATPTRRESDYIGYGDRDEPGGPSAWSGGAREGEAPIQGSDRVTNMMLDKLNAAQEKSLDSPAVRQKVLDRFDRDAEVALKTGDVTRADLQKARELFAKGGFKALRDNLGKGLLPAAAIWPMVGGMQDDEEG